MSMSPPPPGFPPPSPPPPPPPMPGYPPYGYQAPPPAPKTGFWGQFRAMPWWEKVLVIAPLSLIPIGGLIGGVCGAGASAVNSYIARSGMSALLRAVAMIGVLIAAYVVYFIAAVAFVTAIRSAGR